MNKPKKFVKKVNQEIGSSLEQASSLDQMQEREDLSDSSADEDHEETKIGKPKRPKNNTKQDAHRSMTQIFNFPLLVQNSVYWIDCTNFYICNLCKCSILGIDEAYVHITQQFHKLNYNDRVKRPPQIDTDGYCNFLNMHHQSCLCLKCNLNLKIDSSILQCHYLYHWYKNLPKSYQDILQYDCVNEICYLKCSPCDQVIYNDAMLVQHIETPKHMQILDLLHNINAKFTWKDLDYQEVKNLPPLKRLNFKPKVHLRIKNQVSVLNEVSSSTDNQLNNDCQEIIFPPEEKLFTKSEIQRYSALLMNSLVCLACNKRFNSSTLMDKHYRSLKHKTAVNNIRLVMNDSVMNFVQPIDYTKFFLRLSLYGNFEAKLQMLTAEQSIKKEKTIRYQEDVKNFGDEYVSMCIENDNKNIYKLDREEIDLLKLGVSLIFTFDSYRVCIPCEYKFSKSLEFLFEHLQDEAHLKNLCKMKNADKLKKKFSLMNLAKSCLGLDHDLTDYLKCFACEASVKNTDYDLQDHLKSSIHISKIKLLMSKKYFLDKICIDIVNNTWYYAERFLCEVCDLDFDREISFAGHLNQSEHLQKVKNDNLKYKINICFACSTCWYGKSCHSEHYEKNIHKRFAPGFQLFVKDSARKFVRFFDKKLDTLIKESKAQNQEKDLLLLQSIEHTVKSTYPNVKAYTFGSRFACLGSSSSDVDIFLDCENYYNQIGSQKKSQEYIKAIVKNCLKKNTNVWKIEKVLLKARVPIIKLEHKPTRLKCDISFLNGLGVEKSKLIRNYVVAHPICQNFILFLKSWFKTCNLYGSQCINGYAVTWFAIFYLQVRGLVPSVHQLIGLQNTSVIVDGWECGFSNLNILDTTFLQDPISMLKNLIHGFFTYYAKFNYREEVACPFLGKVMKKKAFIVIDNLPMEMGIYKERINTIETEHFRYECPLAIQDPVDLSQNITKAVTKTQLRQFRYSCLVSSNDIGPRQ